ncbi:MAG: glycosyltransferase, partial [Verrucomicrobiales bacterium]
SASAPYGIACYHVNSRLTKEVSEIGAFGGGKALKVFRYIAEAIYCRFRYGVKNLYYVPAPPNLLMPLVRDWVILACCRPFFSRIIFYWHAAGLGDWSDKKASPLQQWLNRKLLGNVALSASPSNVQDAKWFRPKKALRVPYGIPDPAPEFDSSILPHRAERFKKIASALAGDDASGLVIKVFFMALCAKEKGLHDAVKAVALGNKRLAEAGNRTRFHLQAGGHFLNEDERRMFEQLTAQLSAQNEVRHVGFLKTEGKAAIFKESDLFCFPTYYSAESFPIVLIEAMAFGLPIVATRWRSIPELFSADYPGLVDIQAPEQVAKALFGFWEKDYSSELRRQFCQNYTLQIHLRNMAKAIKEVAV